MFPGHTPQGRPFVDGPFPGVQFLPQSITGTGDLGKKVQFSKAAGQIPPRVDRLFQFRILGEHELTGIGHVTGVGHVGGQFPQSSNIILGDHHGVDQFLDLRSGRGDPVVQPGVDQGQLSTRRVAQFRNLLVHFRTSLNGESVRSDLDTFTGGLYRLVIAAAGATTSGHSIGISVLSL